MAIAFYVYSNHTIFIQESIIQTRVLVVDDDYLVRWSLHQSLTNSGYEVTVTEDGWQAAELCCSEQFDFVITDIMMPKLDGWHLLEMLMRFPSPPRVIIMTSFEQDNDRERAKERGAWAYVEKDCLVDEIKSVLQFGAANSGQSA